MIQKIWNTVIPYKLRNQIRLGDKTIIKKYNTYKKINELKKYYKDSDNHAIDICLKYIERMHTINTFNYDFVEKYNSDTVDILFDTMSGLYYYIYFGKKMYLKRSFTKKQAQKYVCSLLMEQDNDSPHKYISETVKVQKSDIVFDVGAAEGNFSLQVIDNVKKVILFECDEEWIEALNKTFEEYKDRCTIINSFVGNSQMGRAKDILVLDDYIRSNSLVPNLIKMDIEGEEINAVRGLTQTIETTDTLTLLLCTYHNIEDESLLRKILDSSFKVEMSDGYMIWGEWKPPYFRKGIMRAFKQ